MNREGFVDQVEQYAKRTDLTQQIVDFFIPTAESRIGRDLKSAENERELDIVVTSNPFPVPDDYGQVRAIEIPAERGPRTLVSVDLHSINNHRGKGAPVEVYAISGKNVHIPDGQELTDATMFYWSRPLLADDQAENEVLDRWPQLYLYATLVELHIFERDDNRAASARDLYSDEFRRINRDAGRARGDKPAMRRA